MEQFGTLPNGAEFEEWMVSMMFKDDPGALEGVLEDFKYLYIDIFKKRFLLTFEGDFQVKALLTVA